MKEGGRGLMPVEDCVDMAVLDLEKYIDESTERMINAAKRSDGKEIESVASYKKRRLQERTTELKEKPLHGQHFIETEGIGNKESWTWIEKGQLKKETVGLIMQLKSNL